jgi:hypothetical protein
MNHHNRQTIIDAGYEPIGETHQGFRGMTFKANNIVPQKLNICSSQITAFCISDKDEWEFFFKRNANKSLPFSSAPIFPASSILKK